MKKIVLGMLMFCFLSITMFAQLKKDGTPDMRYKANKEKYGNGQAAAVKPKKETKLTTEKINKETKSVKTLAPSKTEVSTESQPKKLTLKKKPKVESTTSTEKTVGGKKLKLKEKTQ